MMKSQITSYQSHRVLAPVSDRLVFTCSTTSPEPAPDRADTVVEEAGSVLELGVVLVGVHSSCAVKVSLEESCQQLNKRRWDGEGGEGMD